MLLQLNAALYKNSKVCMTTTLAPRACMVEYTYKKLFLSGVHDKKRKSEGV